MTFFAPQNYIMARVLTGVQSTGTPHLGNILGAIKPAIEMSNRPENEAYLFIANLHSLTQIKNPEIMKEYTHSVAATWLAFGFDIEKNVLYRQSDVPQVTELSWYLNCFVPYPMLANAHSFKDKADRLSDVNAGLFTYPVLMAADIILYDANLVPVGKDQVQHLEITRDIASTFNRQMGETFVLPEVSLNKETMYIMGTDGEKMSKSRNNYINIFLPEKELKDVINKKIITDATPLEAPKDAEGSVVYQLYKLVSTPEQAAEMKAKLEAGGYGWGHCKKDLLEAILTTFAKEREIYTHYMTHLDELDEKLMVGARKAAVTADAVLARVREKIGY